MEKIYIGIDPGITGAIAFIYSGWVEVFDYHDYEGLHRLQVLSENTWKWSAKAAIERVGAMPKQGISSTFKFAVNVGEWRGRLEALGIPFEYVLPKVWQAAVYGSAPKAKKNGKVDVKHMSLVTARELFPQCRGLLSRVKDHNRSDALLIAEYNRRRGL